MLSSYLHLAEIRAEWLVLILPVAFFLGEMLARVSQLERLFARGNRFVAALARKLDRTQRSTATLAYRGMVALLILLVPAMAFGLLLMRLDPAMQLAGTALLVLWFGHALAMQRGWKLWHRARADATPLELPGRDYLFPDSHAVLRYSIATRAESFAVGVVGASFWYVLGGWVLLLVYLTLAAAAAQYRRPAFGWAARSLFALMDALPRLLARLLFILAALFTPAAKPLAAIAARHWQHFVARLFDVTLGGPSPDGDIPWIGSGTARLTPQHLRRFLLLQAVASLLLVLTLASPSIYKLLIKII